MLNTIPVSQRASSKLFAISHRILSGHRVGNEENFVRRNGIFNPLYLLHQLVIDLHSTGGIDDQDIELLFFGLFLGIAGQFFRSGLRPHGRWPHQPAAPERQLVGGGRPGKVRGGQQHPAAFVFQPRRKFSGRCRFTRTLKTGHEDNRDGIRTFQFQTGGPFSEQGRRYDRERFL